jgi:hypothetical protein
VHDIAFVEGDTIELTIDTSLDRDVFNGVTDPRPLRYSGTSRFEAVATVTGVRLGRDRAGGASAVRTRSTTVTTTARATTIAPHRHSEVLQRVTGASRV